VVNLISLGDFQKTKSTECLQSRTCNGGEEEGGTIQKLKAKRVTVSPEFFNYATRSTLFEKGPLIHLS